MSRPVRPEPFKGMRGYGNYWRTFTGKVITNTFSGNLYEVISDKGKIFNCDSPNYPDVYDNWRFAGEEGCPEDPNCITPPVEEWVAGDRFYSFEFNGWYEYHITSINENGKQVKGKSISFIYSRVTTKIIFGGETSVRYFGLKFCKSILWVPRDIATPISQPKYNDKCLACGADAFMLFSSTECSNKSCKNYKG